jgi:outer membrane protein
MRKITAVAALAAAMAFTGTAHADDYSGAFQFKVLATAVLPTGTVNSVKNDAAGVVSGGFVTQTAASDNVTPTIAIEYFLRPNISFETIAGVSAHHVSATAGSVAGAMIVDHAMVVPATLTAKYHFLGLPMGIKPYVGVGPTLFLWVADRPSAAVQGLGVTRTKLSSEVGAVLQAGVDVPVGHGYSIALDAKKYFVKTTAHLDAASGEVEAIRVNLDPWVLSAGVAYRF